MKLVSYEYLGGIKVGAVKNNGVVDLSDVGTSLKEILSLGPLDNLVNLVETRAPVADLDNVILYPVIPDAGRIICVGRNYHKHVKEMGADLPEHPFLFLRTAQSLVGHRQSLIKSKIAEKYDFEGELAVVIGRGGRHIISESALSHVAGYTCFLDGTLRDYQKHSFTAGKNFDSSGACGPWLVLEHNIVDPQSLQIITRVNGKVMQNANTSEMIFSIANLIQYISSFTHLEAGDIIATGTPSGVGSGRTPSVWLASGDCVEVDIEKVGVLSNIVKSESKI
jgi:2-keto-4-pentenoate hydratase/2-oxohepta-3-ene-1,7-dioic acid hydratase in catechol pathway